MTLRGGLLPLPFAELLLEVETVSCLFGMPPVDVVLRVPAGPNSVKASCGLRIVSGALPFCASFFSFFSMSLTTAFRLRAPLADIFAKMVYLCTKRSGMERKVGLLH